jgi:hypothetical protein
VTGRVGAWIESVLPEWFTPTVALSVICGCMVILMGPL